MRIKRGHIYVFDPFNRRSQNENSSVDYILVIKRRSFSTWYCLAMSDKLEVISKEPIIAGKNELVEFQNPYLPNVVIRNPVNLPKFSDADLDAMNFIVDQFNKICAIDPNGQTDAVRGYVDRLTIIKSKIKFYTEIDGV